MKKSPYLGPRKYHVCIQQNSPIGSAYFHIIIKSVLQCKFCKIRDKNSYKRTSLAITLKSRRHDLWSIERYVGKSAVSFTSVVSYA